MSALVKKTHTKYLYFVGDHITLKRMRAAKVHAPEVYRLSPEQSRLVKRYTNATYLYVELLDGRVVRTRDFKANYYRYESEMCDKIKVDEKPKEKERIFIKSEYFLYRLPFREEIEQAGFNLKRVNFSHNPEGTRLFIEVFNTANEKVVDVYYETGMKLYLYSDGLNEVMSAFRDTIFMAMNGIWKPEWTEGIVDRFVYGVNIHITRFKRFPDLKDTDPFIAIGVFKTIPGLDLLNDTLAKSDELPSYFYTDKYYPEKDFKTLLVIAMWLNRWVDTVDCRDFQFEACIRRLPVYKTHKEALRLVKNYIFGGGRADWSFTDKDLDFVGRCIKYLPGGCMTAEDARWVNIMRAYDSYMNGEIPMFNNRIAGQQLNKLNELSEGTMVKGLGKKSYCTHLSKARVHHIYKLILLPYIKNNSPS